MVPIDRGVATGGHDGRVIQEQRDIGVQRPLIALESQNIVTALVNEADSSSVANTTSAQGAGEVDAETTTEADSGRPGCNRSAAERWLGRAGDRAGAWPLAQCDQYGDRARPGTGR